ncbi:hypothetical protein H2198_008695 [Neophaeococcomyces mojaviensis]|uniref:Uncharacterized protein n=1 Tax=Neophaeococcomyces mojaviensis TaxID=3383035 RepID=A0ACC2ZWK0_9EURO|nr:hypothetical protein H2198_008695 [Knufia sp. JES_112]
MIHCVDRSQELTEQLDAWDRHATRFKRALNERQTSIALDADEKDADITRLDLEWDVADRNVKEAQKKEAAARNKHAEAVSNHQRLSLATVQVPTENTPMHWLMFGMSTVKFGWSWLTISTAGKALKETESEHERHKKVAEEFMKNLAGCEDNLKLLRKQKTSLEQYMKFLEQVLNALNRLAGMYKGILTEFSEMRQRITQLKEDQDGANSQFIEEPEVLSESDKQMFLDNAAKMRKWLVIVQHLSWLYADVIQQVMIEPLQNGCAPEPFRINGQSSTSLLSPSGPDTQLSLHSGSSIYSSNSNRSLEQIESSFRRSCLRLDQMAAANRPPPSLKKDEGGVNKKRFPFLRR